MANPKTGNDAAAIVSAAQKQVNALKAIESQFDAKIEAIKDTAWKQPLTQAQLQQVSDLRAQEATVEDAIEELCYVTMGALDNSDELKRLANALTGVVTDLKGRTAAITAIGTDARSFGAICDAISGLVPKLQALAKPS